MNNRMFGIFFLWLFSHAVMAGGPKTLKELALHAMRKQIFRETIRTLAQETGIALPNKISSIEEYRRLLNRLDRISVENKIKSSIDEHISIHTLREELLEPVKITEIVERYLLATSQGGYFESSNIEQLGNVISIPECIRMVKGLNYAFLITTTGQVFAWGYNYFGQLGLGDQQNKWTPSLVHFPNDTTIAQIVTGHCCVFFLTDTGHVFACGSNESGQLGVGDFQNRHRPTPILFPEEKSINEILAENGCVFFLTSSGEVLACGRNNVGQLGVGDNQQRCLPTPISVPDGTTIHQILLGNSYTLFLTHSGQVLACGYNQFGQLGMGDDQNRDMPTHVLLPDDAKIVQISVKSTDGSFFLTDTGHVFACGYNAYGQLGFGDRQDRNLPELIPIPEGRSIAQMVIGDGSIFLLSNSNEVFAWGDNYFGQLGLRHNENGRLPTIIHLSPEIRVTQIITGHNITFFLTDTGHVFASGCNYNGQLGVGDCRNRNQLTQVFMPNSVKVDQIIIKYANTFFLTDLGQSFVCGTSYKLGLGDDNHYINSPTPISFHWSLWPHWYDLLPLDFQ